VARDPYCGNCGYSLVGLTESSKCPECGKPLIDVLERGPRFAAGRRYKSPIVIFGLPLLHIALGPDDEEKTGRAKGIIAIGDVATGWLALGGFARGIIAIGGFSIGVISFGGWSIGLLTAGGGALGLIAMGGGAAGGLAMAGGAVGFVAQGGAAVGYYAEGGGVIGRHVLAPFRQDREARECFARVHTVVGAPPTAGIRWFVAIVGWYVAVSLFVMVALALILLPRYMQAVRRLRAEPRP
jgi:hypothetical protein